MQVTDVNVPFFSMLGWLFKLFTALLIINLFTLFILFLGFGIAWDWKFPERLQLMRPVPVQAPVQAPSR